MVRRLSASLWGVSGASAYSIERDFGVYMHFWSPDSSIGSVDASFLGDCGSFPSDGDSRVDSGVLSVIVALLLPSISSFSFSPVLSSLSDILCEVFLRCWVRGWDPCLGMITRWPRRSPPCRPTSNDWNVTMWQPRGEAGNKAGPAPPLWLQC